MTDVEFLGAPLDSDEVYSLSVVRAEGALILGTKTRGFGMGQEVLPGGKEQFYLGLGGISLIPGFFGANRELRQETGLSVPEHKWRQVGNLYILTEDDERQVQLCEAKLDTKVPLQNSSELQDLSWVDESELPYDDMPDDYPLWLPYILGGYTINAFLEIDESGIYGTILGTREDGQGKAFALTVPE
jgi:8-oxo-dGTP pyrophosphatase MutT (NUDIX family)